MGENSGQVFRVEGEGTGAVGAVRPGQGEFQEQESVMPDKARGQEERAEKEALSGSWWKQG